MGLTEQMLKCNSPPERCADCRYFSAPTAGNTHGWCHLARMKMNVRDATNTPMRPNDWCRHYAVRAATIGR